MSVENDDGIEANNTAAVLGAGAMWLGTFTGHHAGRGLQTVAALPPVFVVVAACFGATITVLALLGHHRRLFALALLVAAFGCVLGWRAEQQFTAAQRMVAQRGPTIDTTARLVGDPIRRGLVTSVVVRLDSGHRVEATAFGPDGHRLHARSFGEQIRISGTLTTDDHRPWQKVKHVTGRLAVNHAELIGRPPWYLLPASEVRAIIASSTRYLPTSLRPLYTGLVTGDDRAQGAGQRAIFQAAGLTHLVAVSGQNVAFVLAIARPVVRSLPYRLRLPFIAAILLTFLLVTRLEPSVLRAVACAMLATWASLTGRARSGVSVLAAATIALLTIDPFLSVVVGFQLSVVASLGILTLTPMLAQRLRGPAVIVEPVAVTVGAQLAVMPLLLVYFGDLPMASVPANLAVGWAAGAVMMLGLTVGILAGLLGRLSATGGVADVAADLLQLPCEILLRWIDWAARLAVSVPLPNLTGYWAVVLGLILAAWTLRPRGHAVGAFVAAVCCLGVAAVAVAGVPRARGEPGELTPGCLWLPSARVMVIVDPCDDAVAGAAVEARITHIDWVVVQGGRRQEAAVGSLRQTASVAVVLAPPLHNLTDARRVLAPTELALRSCGADPGNSGEVGGCRELTVAVRPAVDRRRLVVDVNCRRMDTVKRC